MSKKKKKISITWIFVTLICFCIVIIAAANYKENRWCAGVCKVEYSGTIPISESKINEAQYKMWEGIIAQKILNNYNDIELDVTKDTVANYLEIETDKDIYTVLAANMEAMRDDEYTALNRPIQNALYGEMLAQSEQAGFDPKHYVKMLYGANITLEQAEKVFLLSDRANDYIEWLASDISEEEYMSYYEKHSDDFDDVKAIVVSAESSNENMKVFQELKQGAEALDVEERKEFLFNIDDIDIEVKETTYSGNAPDAFKVWLYGERTYGDITMANTDKCYLVFYESREAASGDWKESAKEKIIELKKTEISSEIRNKYVLLKR